MTDYLGDARMLGLAKQLLEHALKTSAINDCRCAHCMGFKEEAPQWIEMLGNKPSGVETTEPPIQRHSRDCDCTSCHYSKKFPQVKPHHATCGCFECAPPRAVETPACAVVTAAEALLEVLPVPNDYYGDEAQALREALDANTQKASEGQYCVVHNTMECPFCQPTQSKASEPLAHKWDATGERCTVCGDKDWMGTM